MASPFGGKQQEIRKNYFFVKLLMKLGMKNPYLKEKPTLSPEILKEKATEMRSFKCQCDYYVNKLRYMTEDLAQLWENDIQSAFIDEFNGMQGSLKDFSEMVDEYAGLLDLASQELKKKMVDIDKTSVFGQGDGPVAITLTDIPYLRRSRIDLNAYDPYFKKTQEAYSFDVIESRKNSDYMYSVYSDRVELIKYIGLKRVVEIPAEIDGLPVTHIGQDCFAMAWRVKPVSIEIPESVTTLMPGAFRGCQYVRELKLPESLTYIGNYAFAFLTSLEKIEIPRSVISLGMGAFRNCSELLSVEIPNGTMRIGNDCFYRCKNLQSVTIGESVNEVDGWAFRLCEHLSQVEMGENVTEIGVSAFYDDVLLSRVDVPDSVEKIGDTAFYSRRGIAIGCSEGSEAERYAIENRLKIVRS